MISPNAFRQSAQILEPIVVQPLWSIAFRPLFLSAAVFTTLCMCAWLAYLSGFSQHLGSITLSPVVWHLHEMIFAFGGACAMGFLLTAAQNWTGLRSAHGASLIALCLLWWCARISLWNDAVLLHIILQSSWWLLGAGILARLLVRRRSQRNYIFIPILFALGLLDASTLAFSLTSNHLISLHLGRTAVLLFGVLMSIVGGRVIPMFTRNATGSSKVAQTAKLDALVLATSLIGLLSFLASAFTSTFIPPSWLMMAAGLLHLVRLAQWDSWATRSNPLLWSLHMSYFCLGTGLILLGLSDYITQLTFAEALHVIAMGSIGGMILAMISRVSLGHTGRPLQASTGMALAFLLVFIATLSRLALSLMNYTQEAWLLSGVLWISAFSIFIVSFYPILTRARRNPA
jgi:uncharacterized protein involved in response to NO